MQQFSHIFLPEKAEEQVTYEGILMKIAVFVGRRNLSLEAGASEEQQSLIKMGLKNRRKTLMLTKYLENILNTQ